MKISFCVKNYILLAVILVLALANPSYSQLMEDSVVSNGDIVKQIEKSLIFDEDSRNQIDIYSKNSSKKRSEFVINAATDVNEFQSDSVLDILVTNSKINNLDAREKERLAYNTTLVGQLEVAIEIYKQILIEEPKNSYAKLSLAVTYQKIGQFTQAKNLYYELLKSEDYNRELVVANLLNILSEESPREAIYLLSRLAIQNPESPTILASAAMSYDKIKNYDKAIDFLERAVTLDPSRVDYKYNLAIIYDKAENYDKALKLYLDIVKEGPKLQNIPLAQIKKRIEFIKGK